jgi:hypothetical protein
LANGELALQLVVVEQDHDLYFVNSQMDQLRLITDVQLRNLQLKKFVTASLVSTFTIGAQQTGARVQKLVVAEHKQE